MAGRCGLWQLFLLEHLAAACRDNANKWKELFRHEPWLLGRGKKKDDTKEKLNERM